jgi:hypothetical protein
MRTSLKLLLAGGALAIAGVAVAADRTHVLNVAMPDGSIAHIRYAGDVPPRIVVAPAAMPVAFVGEVSPFAMFDRVAAQMDAQMDAMLRQVSALAPAANAQVSEAALTRAPAGTVSYSFTSYSSGNGAACSQSVQVTSLGTGQAPKVERQSAGDCTAMTSRAAIPAVAPAARADPLVTPVSLEKAKPAAPARRTTI